MNWYKIAQLMELNYGCWLSPEGKVIPVSNYGHDEKALELGFKDYWDIIKHGYLRIVIHDQRIGIGHYKTPLTSSQKRIIEQLFSELVEKNEYSSEIITLALTSSLYGNVSIHNMNELRVLLSRI